MKKFKYIARLIHSYYAAIRYVDGAMNFKGKRTPKVLAGLNLYLLLSGSLLASDILIRHFVARSWSFYLEIVDEPFWCHNHAATVVSNYSRVECDTVDCSTTSEILLQIPHKSPKIVCGKSRQRQPCWYHKAFLGLGHTSLLRRSPCLVSGDLKCRWLEWGRGLLQTI